MGLKNTAKEFGSLTKFLHWLIFILILGQFYLAYRREYFPKDSPEKLQYILLHESSGVCILLLALLMLCWRMVGTRPPFPVSMSFFEMSLARVVHFFLYVVLLVMPLSGIAMSLLAGYEVSVFGLVTLPNPFPTNEHLATFFHQFHVYCSYAIIGLVGLHTLGALYHHFIKRDGVLRRMMGY